MKYLLIVLIGLLLPIFKTSAQVVKQGDVIIDAYYGFPNLGAFFAKKAHSVLDIDGLSVKSMGPMGLRGEYLLVDKIGLGADVTYNYLEIDYTTNSVDSVNYSSNFKSTRIGAMVTFNYHFVQNDALDAYLIVGAGYAHRKAIFESEDPDESSRESGSIFPVSARVGVGLRYFFTPNFGLNLQIGLGQGGLLNGGITTKF